MGLLDSFEAENNAAAEDMLRRPPPNPVQSPKFNAWKATTAAPRGVAAGAAESAGFAADILGAFGQVAGAYPEIMGGPVTPEQTKQADKQREKLLGDGVDYSSEGGDVFRGVAKSYMPDPATAHAAEQTVFGLTRFGTKAVGYSLMAGPAAGSALLGADEAMTTADALRLEGVDLATRTKVGAVSGVVGAAGVALPIAGKTVAQTLGLVAAGGPGAFIGQQAATRQILQDAGYDHLATQYDPFDPVGLAVSTLVPAGFGAWAMRGMRGRAAEVKPGDVGTTPEQAIVTPEQVRPTPEQVDAARVEMLTQHVESARLTPPEDVVGARAHDEAMARAMDQLARGERVEVSDVARVEPEQIAGKIERMPDPKDAPGQIGETRTGDSTEGAAIRRSGWYKSQGKDIDLAIIRADAESLADQLRAEGFGVEVQHSGSVIGPSSYLNITDPQTGRHFINQVRLSAHAKTGFQASHVWDVTPAQFGFVMDEARKMRAMGVSEGMKRTIAAAEQYEAVALRKRLASADKKLAKGKPLTKSEQEAVDARARGELPNFEQPAPDQGGANVQDAPQARADAPATGARQPGPAAQPQAADARGAAPAGAAEQGGGVPRAGGPTPEAAAVAARLADVSQQFPDLTVQMDGMDSPMRLADFLEQVQREAMDGNDFDLGGNDAPLMQVAATCFLLNG